ncbi:hypothetical protein ABH15_01075 [Methanoculleus taiwanensis]|uniref:Histidine kinase/HSP90-like ATPase domain-containing protein n=1 Tax=Methanoculleus taiwanensis TaxID=1550565 RepID=A0A498H1H7_9EURY|nr:ATP-binding protein [Methanoculleus taiwanensis]RXE56789.1 hypothetical protein ABH15_01075 [Methanoculleus taiwanensis]
MTLSARLTVPADLENLSVIAGFLEETLEEAGCSAETLFAVQLAVDEACSNTILYGYPGGERGAITITCEVDADEVRVMLADDGRPFNPLNAREPDLTAGLEERKIGGLGVHFIKSVMDSVTYAYSEEKNVLLLVKRESTPGR